MAVSCTSRKPAEQTETVVAEPTFMFDIQVDSFEVIQNQIGRNQFLADLLMQYNVSYPVIERLTRVYRDTFDVRRIRAGNNYFLMMSNDSLRTPRFFIYEISASEYVVYSLSDSIYAYRGRKPVETRIETAHGQITSSLWNALVDQGYEADLAIKMADIYAWTIDFFGIQKNDRFELVYERKYIEGRPVGVGKVLSARFWHAGKDHYAVYFEQNGQGDYFDFEGQSLRRAFLKAPLKYSRVSSHFSHGRYHPILKFTRPHYGVDYAAPAGTPVYSIGNGVVTRKGFQAGGAGNFLYIKHNATYTTAYMHLQKFAPGIQQGTRVSQGQLIGYVGSTGLSTGPHLDFRFFKNGQPVDPLKVESPPALPVEQKYMAQFKQLAEEQKAVLKKVLEEVEPATQHQGHGSVPGS
ncbi:MAG TPA: peptidoglycan DD-metalloendopeptidase family protein [Bacteroidales bacterium]|nr:peptidoglycan DD-metalloendopeptidase family protein [Bacteroidales bacterium]